MATKITIENNVHLDRLLTTNPEMDKKIRNIVRKVLEQAQKSVQQEAMTLSKKQAYKAVRKTIYKTILGGNINILSGRRSGQRAPLPAESARKTSHERGGNRMPRSQRTEDLLTYAGSDRGFVLRFLNNGTIERNNGTRRTGSISARRWFTPVGERNIERAANQFEQLVTALIAQEFNGK
jgi:hypothetical protein